MQHKKIILCAFVISGLQVQLLSPAPRKILRYIVETAACIAGFLLLYALQIYQNLPCFCLIAQKMPCRNVLTVGKRKPPGGAKTQQRIHSAGGTV